MYTFESEHYILYLWGEIVRFCGLAEVLSHKKDWVRKPPIRKEPHLRKVRKSKIFLKSANFRMWDFWNLFADPPLLMPECRENLVRYRHFYR